MKDLTVTIEGQRFFMEYLVGQETDIVDFNIYLSMVGTNAFANKTPNAAPSGYGV